MWKQGECCYVECGYIYVCICLQILLRQCDYGNDVEFCDDVFVLEDVFEVVYVVV